MPNQNTEPWAAVKKNRPWRCQRSSPFPEAITGLGFQKTYPGVRGGMSWSGRKGPSSSWRRWTIRVNGRNLRLHLTIHRPAYATIRLLLSRAPPALGDPGSNRPERRGYHRKNRLDVVGNPEGAAEVPDLHARFL